MATIQHRKYYSDISVQNMVRFLANFLVTEEAKPGVMWTSIWSQDAAPGNEFESGSIVKILQKFVDSANGAPMYVKIVLKNNSITTLVSNQYVPANDNNDNYVLTGSCKSQGEDTNDWITVIDNAGNIITPAACKVPTVYLPQGFDMGTQKLSKAWFIRKLDPLLDVATPRKNTDIYAWCSFCIDEQGSNPLDVRGFFQHFGFGAGGDILVTDDDLTHGACFYSIAGSFARSANINPTASDMVFPGGGTPTNTDANIGGIMLAGLVDEKQTWFYPNTEYGYVRKPFDDDRLVGGNNVGIDFTEMCKYSPYSGVRTLTPAYHFGRHAGLYKPIGRFPITYTQLTGIYAGDIISQDKLGTIKDFQVFPFHYYSCGSDPEDQRGLAIHVPAEEDV